MNDDIIRVTNKEIGFAPEYLYEISKPSDKPASRGRTLTGLSAGNSFVASKGTSPTGMAYGLNPHNKQEYPPMHTAEHILNQTMVRVFGCPRSRNAHIERKKSKADYELSQPPTDLQVLEIERRVNEQIARNMDVRIDYMTREEAASLVDLTKLPDDASETLRIVRIGDYDNCACIGTHVTNTRYIGTFKILTHDFADGRWRMRFRLENTPWTDNDPVL